VTHRDPRVTRLVAWYEQISQASLAELPALYAVDARFKDPFNDVQGTAAIHRVFQHMFDTLRAPRFKVLDIVAERDACMLVWRFDFASGSGPTRHIRGATHIVFDAEGRVKLHRDYWDAAEELYQKLPLLGLLMRWLRRRLAAR